MFVLCPHCQFLVALDAASGRPPVRCPRCQAALKAASAAAPGATEPTPAQATDLDDDRRNRDARGTGAPTAEPATADAGGGPQVSDAGTHAPAAKTAAGDTPHAFAAPPSDDTPRAPPLASVPSGESPQAAVPPAGTTSPDRVEAPGPLPDATTRAADRPTTPEPSVIARRFASLPDTEKPIAAVEPEPETDTESAAPADPAPPPQGKPKRRTRPKPEPSTADDIQAPPAAGSTPPATGRPDANADADADAERAGALASAPQPKSKPRRRRKTKAPTPAAKPTGDSAAAAAVPRPARLPAKPAPSFARRPTSGSGIAPRRDWRSTAAIAGLLLVLALQLLVADRAQLAADPRWRPGMVALCRTIGCALPAWREPAAFTLLQRDVRAHPTVPGALRVTATFRNDARWAQAWPRVVLTLSDVDGRTAGMRAFEARDYLPRGATQKELPSGQSASLRLDILEPSPRIVAFSFDFR